MLSLDESCFLKVAVNSVSFALKYKVTHWKCSPPELSMRMLEIAEDFAADRYDKSEVKKLIEAEMKDFVGGFERALVIEYELAERVKEEILNEAEQILKLYKSMYGDANGRDTETARAADSQERSR